MKLKKHQVKEDLIGLGVIILFVGLFVFVGIPFLNFMMDHPKYNLYFNIGIILLFIVISITVYKENVKRFFGRWFEYEKKN